MIKVYLTVLFLMPTLSFAIDCGNIQLQEPDSKIYIANSSEERSFMDLPDQVYLNSIVEKANQRAKNICEINKCGKLISKDTTLSEENISNGYIVHQKTTGYQNANQIYSEVPGKFDLHRPWFYTKPNHMIHTLRYAGYGTMVCTLLAKVIDQFPLSNEVVVAVEALGVAMAGTSVYLKNQFPEIAISREEAFQRMEGRRTVGKSPQDLSEDFVPHETFTRVSCENPTEVSVAIP